MGLDPVITLPFNWGDVCPEAIFDEAMNHYEKG